MLCRRVLIRNFFDDLVKALAVEPSPHFALAEFESFSAMGKEHEWHFWRRDDERDTWGQIVVSLIEHGDYLALSLRVIVPQKTARRMENLRTVASWNAREHQSGMLLDFRMGRWEFPWKRRAFTRVLPQVGRVFEAWKNCILLALGAVSEVMPEPEEPERE